MKNLIKLAEDFRNEKELQNAIALYLHNNGWLVLRINSALQNIAGQYLRSYYIYHSEYMNGGTPIHNGIPDLLALHHQRPALFVECKFGGNTLSANQKKFAEFAVTKHMKIIVANNMQIFQHWHETTFNRKN